HATSKISLPEHLSSISSLGFRGEALASIASVAKCEMETKMRDEISGVFLKIEDGRVTEESECGCPEGTKISVFNLFYNTPARRKYMKSATSEHKKIVELTSEFALAHPEVSFRLVSDGKVA
ncbi:DNA mismatch repair protein MutL, partial [Candidatus Peregrinibacteria bacterium CG10_big_fil_rev_8_21_14_0_10_44_7]